MSDLAPERVAEMHQRGEVQLIDVREPDEWAAGRVSGSRFIPLTQLSSSAGEIDRQHPVVFVCRSGARSAMAAEAFAGAGYEAHNLVGGLKAWTAAGLPLEPENGRVA